MKFHDLKPFQIFKGFVAVKFGLVIPLFNYATTDLVSKVYYQSAYFDIRSYRSLTVYESRRIIC